ncbi:MAG: CoA transferase subunit B [Bacteroidales bacterium]|nr:CoA transferase subunit B [Bacteroidales bacterium]
MDKQQMQQIIAKRVAKELHDGDVVNLGIGLPTMAVNYLPKDVHVILQTENGMLGFGPTPEEGKEDPFLTNSGGGYITAQPGAASFSSADSFALIRGGHVDATVLGAMQVDEHADLANWMVPGKLVAGMGGAMDLLTNARVIIAMIHTQKGAPKILHKCNLPLTAKGKVNMIITEMCEMEFKPEGLTLTELYPEFTVEDVKAATEADFIVSPDLKPMEID